MARSVKIFVLSKEEKAAKVSAKEEGLTKEYSLATQSWNYDKKEWNNVENIDFDIYSLGGESKIHPFMNGLYETDLKNNVTYIGIYDNDGVGKKTLKKAGFDPEIKK